MSKDKKPPKNEDKIKRQNEIARRIGQVVSLGHAVVVDAETAEIMGAFVEDAISPEDAWNSRFDGDIDFTSPNRPRRKRNGSGEAWSIQKFTGMDQPAEGTGGQATQASGASMEGGADDVPDDPSSDGEPDAKAVEVEKESSVRPTSSYLEFYRSAEVSEKGEGEPNQPSEDTVNDKADRFKISADFVLKGRPKLQKFFNEHIIDVIAKPEKYRTVGIDFPAAVLLTGKPGTGKTFAVNELAKFMKWPVYTVDAKSVGSYRAHQLEKKLHKLFEKAKEDAPSILLIDEIEGMIGDRNMGGRSVYYHVAEVGEFLKVLQKCRENKVLVFGMTNHPELVDPAAMRTGRIDHIVELEPASKEEIAELLDTLLAGKPVGVFSKGKIVDAAHNRPLSDVAFLVNEASRLSVYLDKDRIDQDCFDQAIKLLRKPVGEKNPIGFTV